MKILFIAGIFPPDIGGPAQYIPRVAQALIKNGHKVTVLCFSDVPSFNDEQKFRFKVVRIMRTKNIFIREIRTIIQGIKLAKKADVIYANGNDFKAYLIGLVTRKNCVHKIVGDTSWERCQNRGWFRGTLDEYQVAKKSFFLNCLDWIKIFPLKQSFSIITPSCYLKEIVHGWNVPSTKIQVIYNSFEPLPNQEIPNELVLKIKPQLKYMCTICRLVPWKGVDQLIDVLNEFPILGLIIVGDGPLDSKLRSLVEEKKLQDRVIFAGRQPREYIKQLIEASFFFILNSSYEGLPHVVLEAMSCKRLVLATRVGGTPEVVKHQITGLLFEYNQLDTLKSTLSEALNSSHVKIIDGATQFIENNFSFEKMINETEKALKLASEN